MNSEEISTIAVNPFIRKFVLAIIQSIRVKNLPYEERHVIHADLVPKVSDKVMRASLGERTISRGIIKKRNMNELVAPIAKPRVVHTPITPPVFVQRVAPTQDQVPQMTRSENIVAPPSAPHGVQVGLTQNYGKITLLLNDPSVSVIECQGVGEPIMVIRAGQKQITKIVLSADDIKKILRKVSDAAHIPLLEGVFRAAVENFSINAVISEIIGSKFVIKKQTAYAMLER